MSRLRGVQVGEERRRLMGGGFFAFVFCIYPRHLLAAQTVRHVLHLNGASGSLHWLHYSSMRLR